MYLLYSILLFLVLVLGSPYWLYQMLRHGKYRHGLRQRFGVVPEALRRITAPVIWVHAVSVGEVLAVSELVSRLRSEFPSHRVLISTTTDTGQKLAASRFGAENVFYFPLDFEFAAKRWLAAIRPKLIVIAETELWPNFLRAARKAGTRVAVVNARISDRSFSGYRRGKRFLREELAGISIFLTQTNEDARRLVEIGAPVERVIPAGNLKYDVPTPPAPAILAKLRGALTQEHAGPVLVCGSTVEGEELLLAGAFKNVLASFPRAVMLLAPRHPQRFAEVAELLRELNTPVILRSRWTGEPLTGQVFLVDSIGELAALYALADVAFVGGSLVERGGHNIIEPAQHGVAIVVGNHTENFRDIVSLFESRDAVRVVGPAEFPLQVLELLKNSAERAGLGRRAAETLASQRGATDRVRGHLKKLLDDSSAGAMKL
jgi:3-deoxy-D-manno-octulosonic-acid transferase